VADSRLHACFEDVRKPSLPFEVASVVTLSKNDIVELEAETLRTLLTFAAEATRNTEKKELAKPVNFGIIEFGCDSDSAIGQVCEILGIDCMRIDEEADFMRDDTMKLCFQFVNCHDFVHVHAAIPCTPWSQMQKLNCKMHGESFKQRLARARRWSLMQVARFLVLARHVKKRGGTSSFEWPKTAIGWERPLVKQLIRELEYKCVYINGCAVGLKSRKTGLPILKPWRFETDNPELIRALLPKVCSKDHEHTPCEGAETKRSGHYPTELAELIVKSTRKFGKEACKDSVQKALEVQELEIRENLALVATAEETKAFMELGQKKRQELIDAARKIHVNTGHKPPSELARLLRKQNAPLTSRAAMESVRCSTCAEHKRPEPSPVVSLKVGSTPFRHVSMDIKEVLDSTHKYKYLVMICDATRFTRSIQLMKIPKNQSRNATTEEVLQAINRTRLDRNIRRYGRVTT
jgi:hypothetical protein